MCACVRACARVVQPRGVCVWGGTVGCGGRAPLTPFFPPTPLIPFTEHGFQDPPGLLLLSPWLRGGGGRRQLGPAAAPAAPANPQRPFLSLPQAGPHPLLLWGAGAGRWWPMRRGSRENLSRASPPPFPPRPLHPPLEGARGWLLGPRWGRGPAGW